MAVSETGRGSGAEIHPLDVVVLVKRYASDQELCQDWFQCALALLSLQSPTVLCERVLHVDGLM